MKLYVAGKEEGRDGGLKNHPEDACSKGNRKRFVANVHRSGVFGMTKAIQQRQDRPAIQIVNKLRYSWFYSVRKHAWNKRRKLN